MHEASLIRDLTKKVNEVAINNQKNGKIVSIKVKLGALSHISASHFKDHFEQETRGTFLEGTNIAIEELHDPYDPLAQEIILESVEFEAEL